MADFEGTWTSALWPPELEAAVRLAARAHHWQFRKRSGEDGECDQGATVLPEDCIPYMTHLTGTAIILARAGGGPSVVAAGLLHDLLEDVPDADGEALIERAAGRRVLELVLAVTEDKDRGRPAPESWEDRKASQLDRLQTAEDDVVLIKAADALHNLLSLIADLRAAPKRNTVWELFNAPPELELEYFRRLSRTVGRRLRDHPVARELAAAVELLSSLHSEPDGVG